MTLKDLLKIKNKKKLYIILKNLYGINKYRSNFICAKIGVNKNIRMHELNEKHLILLEDLLTDKLNWLLFDKLKKFEYSKIENLKRINTYKGMRHTLKMPVNGQRTKNNARTRREKKKKKNYK